MRWGDFIEETGPVVTGHILDDVELLFQQACDSIEVLEQFDKTKPFKIGWYIEQE